MKNNFVKFLTHFRTAIAFGVAIFFVVISKLQNWDCEISFHTAMTGIFLCFGWITSEYISDVKTNNR